MMIYLANPRLKKIFIDQDFSKVLIKGRGARGCLVTRNPVHRISLKSHGHSTLGGRKVWFDPDVNRLNYDEHGRFLGEFNEDESIVVILDNGEFYCTNFDANNHYEDNIFRLEKLDPQKVWTAVVFDADNNGHPYLKRFVLEASKRKQSVVGDNPQSRLALLTDTVFPRLEMAFTPLLGSDGTVTQRAPMEIDAEQFVAVKGFKAKGKRICTWEVDSLKELEPLRLPEPVAEEADDETAADEATQAIDAPAEPEKTMQQEIDEQTGQLNLFGNDTDA